MKREYHSIGTKIIAFSLTLIIGLLVFMSVAYAKMGRLSDEYRILMHDIVAISNVNSTVDEMLDDFEEYLTLKTTDSLNRFNSKYDELYQLINSMSIVFYTEEEQVIYKNINSQLLSFNAEMDSAIRASRGRNPYETRVHYEVGKNIVGQMKESISALILVHAALSEEIYNELVAGAERLQSMMITFLTALAGASALIAFRFSKSLVHPLEQLTDHVSRVFMKEDNLTPVKVEANDEIGILAGGFNSMLTRIEVYIQELKYKSKIEGELQNKEMENLKIKNLLDQTNMLALQSQINPHFLYNTLSCIAQTAMLEDANDTYTLLITVSDMMRYNLISLDRQSTIGQEIENVKRYFYIQKARYRERLNYQINIETPELRKFEIPRLTVQPFVENSIIHGLENSENEGIVLIRVFEADGRVCIEITDNGVGMDAQTRSELLGEMGKKGHTTGIGVRNVVERLRLYYRNYDIIRIESAPGVGTKITFLLPKTGKNDN